jgi:catechol 2,3-dioxygenase-like lactoylglutathione lyase family enzyme
MQIKLVGAVIFVKDIKAACRFYTEVLDQKIDVDFGANVGFVGGLSLWQRDHATQVIFQRPAAEHEPHHDHAELYFETDLLDEVYKRLEEERVDFIQALTEQPWGARATRFYDFDGHIVELSEPMTTTIARMLAQGMTVEAVVQKTAMPLEIVQQIAAA